MYAYVAYCADSEDRAFDIIDAIETAFEILPVKKYKIDADNGAAITDNTKDEIRNARVFIIVYSNNTFGTVFEHSTIAKMATNAVLRIAYSAPNSLNSKAGTAFKKFQADFECVDRHRTIVDLMRPIYDKLSPAIRQTETLKKISDEFSKFLSPSGLIYLRYGHYKTTIFQTDILEKAATAYKKTKERLPGEELNIIGAIMEQNKKTPTQQKALYDKAIEDTLEKISELNNVFWPCGQRELLRAVFDVRAGAFFWYETEADYNLCGITANQHMVDDCDKTMAKLCAFLKENPITLT